MKKTIIISLAAIILTFTNCVKPEEGGNENPPAPQEQITIPSTVDVKPVVAPEGGDTKITFTAAEAWTASVISTKADSWVDVNPKSGNPGSAEIKITTTPNDTYVERNATIQIKCGTETKDIVLTQKQLDNITVTTGKVELGAEGGSFTIELKSNIEYSYEISGDWIKYVSTKAYTDNTLTFSAEPNDGVQKREGSITVKGGEFSETVKVYQEGKIYIPVTDMVDLGLSVKWATCNIGASKPEEYGGYYQWAGLEDVTSTSIYLDWTNCPYHTGWDNETGWTKYIPINRSSYWLGSGSPDNKTVLDPEDDVAYKTLGDKWRMPTDDEWSELSDNCTWTWTDNYNGTGVAGRIVTSNISGYTDKSIFLPAAGYRSNGSFGDLDRDGSYWCSSLAKDYPCYAFGLHFDFDYVGGNFSSRYDGRSVRPVYGDRTSESVNFPDEAFRNYMVQNFDLDNDGAISMDEASKVEMIIIETTDIESLSGIEYCSELIYLSCCGISKGGKTYRGKLKEVDVSKNPKLISLMLDDNSLESLDISKNDNLQGVSCRNNNISSINISNNTNMYFLDISGNNIVTMNLASFKNLNSLYANDNKLTSLDLSENQVLEWIEVSNNKLENLVLPSSAVVLHCMNNNLKTVDFSNTTKLYELLISNAENINLSRCTELESLHSINVKNVNISNTNLNYDYGFSEIIGANYITAKNCKRLEFKVNTSSCSIDTDVPTVKVFAYDQINTNIRFGDSKVNNLYLENYRNVGDGEKCNGQTFVASKYISFIDVYANNNTVSFCYGTNDKTDAVPNLKKINIHTPPTEIRFSKVDMSQIQINRYYDMFPNKVYIAKSKLQDFGPFVPIQTGYLWKYVEEVPIIVNTRTQSIISPKVFTTEAKETNWNPQKEGYEWHPVKYVDFGPQF